MNKNIIRTILEENLNHNFNVNTIYIKTLRDKYDDLLSEEYDADQLYIDILGCVKVIVSLGWNIASYEKNESITFHKIHKIHKNSEEEIDLTNLPDNTVVLSLYNFNNDAFQVAIVNIINCNGIDLIEEHTVDILPETMMVCKMLVDIFTAAHVVKTSDDNILVHIGLDEYFNIILNNKTHMEN